MYFAIATEYDERGVIVAKVSSEFNKSIKAASRESKACARWLWKKSREKEAHKFRAAVLDDSGDYVEITWLLGGRSFSAHWKEV